MKRIRKYPYLFLLSISFLVVGAAWKCGLIDLDQQTDVFSQQHTVHTDVKDAEMHPMDLPSEEAEVLEPEDTGLKPEVPLPPMEGSEEKEPVFYTADRTYFDNTLFIGDSRTVGLHEYGDLGNAVVVADSGMSVYKIFQQSFRMDSGEKVTLNDLLSERQFEKIYIMLGINELGYPFESTVKRYKEMVTTIKEAQPETMVFLQANLHIAEKKSASSDIYNNENINRFNDTVKEFSEEDGDIYLDVNEIFDDGNGNLAEEFTADQSHVLGKYYADWVEWILQHAVTFQ